MTHNDDDHHQPLTASTAAALNNIESIERAPFVALGRVDAGTHLLALAVQGHDVYVYRSAGGDIWNVWLEGIRLTIEQYVRWYDDQVARKGGAA